MRRPSCFFRFPSGGVWTAIAVLLVTSAGCGSAGRVETQERWYPTHSYYRVTQKSVIVFIHGYGGTEESFAFVPFLAAATPGRTILYFNYSTSALRGRLDSFSVIGSQLRHFLHNNVFSRQSRPVDVICHSTGCPVVRQYIVDNPRDHGIRKIIMVAGANNGAYFAETGGSIKDWTIVPLLHGDKQIHELRYGSPTLFTLQRRWHCSYLVARRPYDPEGFKTSICRDYTNEQEWTHLPEIAVIAGTDRRGSFSDGVVRVESATLDCRFVAEAFPEWTGVPQLPGSCQKRLIVFLPCFHTRMFDIPACRRVVLDLVESFLIDHDDPVKRQGARARLLTSYRAAIAGTGVTDNISRLKNGAVWIRLRYDDEGAQSVDDPAAWTSRFNGVRPKLAVAIAAADDTWVLGASATEAERTVFNAPERIFYWRNVSAPSTTTLEILVNEKPTPIFRTIPRAKHSAGFGVSVRAGQTTFVHCDWLRTAEDPGFYCEDLTSGE